MKNTPLGKIPTVLLSAALFASFLMTASSVSANGTTILPTSVSGGVGDVFDVKANDSRAYEVAKSGIATIGGFGAYGGAITSVYLMGEFSVDAGYNGSNALLVNGNPTSIIPADGDAARWFTLELDPAVDITNLTIGFTNNDGGQGDSVHFNYVNLLVNPTLPITMPPVLGEFVDAETPQGTLPFSGGSNWQLEFSDEFNGTTLDTAKWGIDVSSSSRAARPTQGIDDWWWKSENVVIDGSGFVELQVTKQDSNTMYCGSISSDGLYEPQYGYLEARIKIADTSKSTHTAFWTQADGMLNNPPDGSAADGAEVDVFESAWTGDYTKAVVHIDGYSTGKSASTKQYSTPGLHSGYHVFGLEWDASSMKIYYDGVLKVTYTGNWVPQVPEWLWLSVGASFGDVGTFVSEPVGLLTSAEVDYVRVWQAVADTTSPAISSLSPADEASGVLFDSNLVLTFDEDIATGSGLITIKNLADTSQSTIDITDGSQVSISGATLTINPSSNLLYGKNYAVQIAATAVEDLAGNAFAGISDDTTWNFATDLTDTVAPQISSLSPADNANSIPVGSDLVITFDENIAAGSGLITIKNLTDTSQSTIDITDGTQISISGSTLTINLSTDLGEIKDYAVQITSTAIEDLSGNPFAGISDDATWNFTSSGPVPEGILVYEGFQYGAAGADRASSDLFNNQPDGNGGDVAPIGLGGSWTDLDGPGVSSDLFVQSGSLAFGDLSTTGNHVRTDTNNNNDRFTNTVTADLDVGSAIWFSIVAEKLQNNNSAAEGGLVIGNQAVNNSRVFEDTGSTGLEGFAVAPTTSGSNWTAYAWNGSSQVAGDAVLSVGVGTGDRRLLVGKIVFDAGAGGTDQFSLYEYQLNGGFVEGGTLSPICSTIEVNVDQTTLSVLSLTRQVNTAYDELRIGLSLAAVVPGPSASDTTPPTLVSANILDDQGGADVAPATLVTYTVSFSEDMDGTTVDAADFSNAGTASVTIGTITETSPGVFTVEVTPTTAGTLQLQVSATAVLTDVAGNTLDTASAISDDTTIDVVSVYDAWVATHGLSDADAAPGSILQSDGIANLQKFAFGMDPNIANFNQVEFVVGGDVTATGSPALINFAQPGQANDERAVFARLKNHAAAGLTYIVDFSADLQVWTTSNVTPTVLTSESSTGDLEVVSVPFLDIVPVAGGGAPSPPKFMRVGVSND